MSGTPAETIRRAAGLMRERAEGINLIFPWRAEGRVVTATQDFDGDDPDWDMGFGVAVCTRQDEAEHIASWHPLVAAAVADWLDAAAKLYEDPTRRVVGNHALKIARAYLGEAA